MREVRSSDSDASGETALERFCRAVLQDATLRHTLQLEDAEAFVAAVVDAGAARGFTFTAADVRAAMAETSRLVAVSGAAFD